MNAFSHFFRAEAQASKSPARQLPLSRPSYSPASRLVEELAIKKEAYTFAAQVKADREKEFSSRTQRNRHLMLDNRGQQRVRNHQPHTPATRQPAPIPRIASQIITDAINTPVNDPIPIPPIITSTIDSGPDVLNIIARSKELDRSNSTHLNGVANEDLFATMNLMGITSTS
ncbi:uncharacterized protein EDB91DRAFT_1250231 [Suillus paluster]|uniref:uncharacterized protein n=1 Tax=Suillus paluster TaxID=48578 RepID=UPI001B871F2E|nr:uncharacterized protein EDB91DRAFT_1250231 [Suillus paluster]KAG1735900.1 hypothetical protein EDB91DRAFT_1250231 [Suillus paluster]